ncbi:hypothetical protein RIF29_07670 [Crotalaria pallida]|uniref:Uncharacterized protein n=1 Tax=Crotalaria pallida TaxID=3830 RepID=A0AAN9PAX7_CROPI
MGLLEKKTPYSLVDKRRWGWGGGRKHQERKRRRVLDADDQPNQAAHISCRLFSLSLSLSLFALTQHNTLHSPFSSFFLLSLLIDSAS